jgi:hypothetical protein
LRDKELGLLESLLQSPLILLLRAQYASALLLPFGPILLPDWPYLTVLVRPVSGFFTFLLNRFFIHWSPFVDFTASIEDLSVRHQATAEIIFFCT